MALQAPLKQEHLERIINGKVRNSKLSDEEAENFLDLINQLTPKFWLNILLIIYLSIDTDKVNYALEDLNTLQSLENDEAIARALTCIAHSLLV